MTRLPLIPTVLVAGAIGTMIALGIWQLGRADEKEALIARYLDAARSESAVPFPRTPAEIEDALYRRSSFSCDEVVSQTSKAARNTNGRSGVGQVATCSDGQSEVETVLGWAVRPDIVKFEGGEITGWLAPLGDGVQLVADPPLAGLDQVARPDPEDTPNNHLAYAGQWFFFALTALVIYILALRKRGGRRRQD